MTVRLGALQARVVVLDVEGTTTPIAFVYEVLFPFARAHAAAYLEREWNTAACRDAVALLWQERAAEPVGKGVAQDFSPASVLAYVYRLMDEDRKSPGLKALQGLIWHDGFSTGELRGPVYDDVPPALKRWQAQGIRVYIYSSGSVLAQRLLFGSSSAGDLTTLLSGHFDTAIGPKTACESYMRIAEEIHAAPSDVLFVSDVVTELDAAKGAGMRTALCVRGAADNTSGPHPVIHTFDDIED